MNTSQHLKAVAAKLRQEASLAKPVKVAQIIEAASALQLLRQRVLTPGK